MSSEIIQKIENLAEQVAITEGCKLYLIEFSSGAGARTLRVYIDKAVEGGATLDDCAKVSRGLSLILDETDPIPGGHYSLEVSTPGVERPLKKAWHFSEAAGKKIWLRLNQPLKDFGVQSKKFAENKQLEEILQASDESGIRFNLDNEETLIPFSAIEKAHVVFEFGSEKGKKK